MQTLKKENIKIFVLAFLLLLIDLISKFQANVYLKEFFYIDTLHLLQLNENLSLSLVHHYRGINLFGGDNNVGILLVILLMTYLFFYAFVYKKITKQNESITSKLSFAFIAAGMGNIIEIVYHGYATDFLYFRPLNELLNSVGIFNIADIFLFIGGFLFILHLIIEISAHVKDRTEKKKKIALEQN